MDDDLTKSEKLRLTALDRAIQSGAGTTYNDMALATVNPDKLIEAAKKFEIYLKGE
jgi:hypothetical protein